MCGLDVHYDFGGGQPLLGRRMPDLDLVTAGGVLIGRDGRAGNRRQIAPNASSSGSPCVAAIRGNYEVFYREPEGGGLHNRSSGNHWAQGRTTHQATNDEACAVAWHDEALVFFSHPCGTRARCCRANFPTRTTQCVIQNARSRIRCGSRTCCSIFRITIRIRWT